jgi:capsular polysaccharide export protein
MGNLLHLVDEVHVLTSLTGFEALLRGKSVTCYGQPFYAGWGLTIDKSPIVRRSRHLSLDELVAGALILHPVYLSNHSNRFTTPERVLDELLQTRESDNPELKWWSSTYRLIVKIFKLRR